MQQERDRIRYGKELQAAKREEDSLALKRNLEARRIEKEEERRAREKIRVKLGTLHAAVHPRMPDLIPSSATSFSTEATSILRPTTALFLRVVSCPSTNESIICPGEAVCVQLCAASCEPPL